MTTNKILHDYANRTDACKVSFYHNELYERRMCVDTKSYLKSTS